MSSLKHSFRVVVILSCLVLSGRPAPAILGGEPDGDGHPFVGFLAFTRPAIPNFHVVCSTTLVSPDTVLAPAFCTKGLEERFQSGALHLWVGFASDPTTVSTSDLVPVAELHIFPTFDFSDFD